jgi:dihydroneopterin aldolase
MLNRAAPTLFRPAGLPLSRRFVRLKPLIPRGNRRGASVARGKTRRKRTGNGGTGVSRIFVRDLVLACRIGIHPHERELAQRVCFNVDLMVATGSKPAGIADVVSYEDVVLGIKRIIAAGHIDLVEILADRIASFCLEDRRVASARVRVEKLDVFKEAASAGVEIERGRKNRR